MNKIIKIDRVLKICKELKSKGKSIVLVGGCFDILHLGHINFLENSKNLGDILFVLLESDEAVGKLKGKDRPINNQRQRAQVLAALRAVDYVILLPIMKTDKDYDKLITQIKPAFIAATENDPNISHKIRQAGMIDAKVKIVTKRVDNKSTTKLARLISRENIL